MTRPLRRRQSLSGRRHGTRVAGGIATRSRSSSCYLRAGSLQLGLVRPFQGWIDRGRPVPGSGAVLAAGNCCSRPSASAAFARITPRGLAPGQRAPASKILARCEYSAGSLCKPSAAPTGLVCSGGICTWGSRPRLHTCAPLGQKQGARGERTERSSYADLRPEDERIRRRNRVEKGFSTQRPMSDHAGPEEQKHWRTGPSTCARDWSRQWHATRSADGGVGTTAGPGGLSRLNGTRENHPETFFSSDSTP